MNLKPSFSFIFWRISLLLVLFSIQCLIVNAFQFKYDYVVAHEGKGRKLSNSGIASTLIAPPNKNDLILAGNVLTAVPAKSIEAHSDTVIQGDWQKRVQRIHSAKKSSLDSMTNVASSPISNLNPISTLNELKPAPVSSVVNLVAAESQSTPIIQNAPISIASVAPKSNYKPIQSNPIRRSQTVGSEPQVRRTINRFVAKPSNQTPKRNYRTNGLVRQPVTPKPTVYINKRRIARIQPTTAKPEVNIGQLTRLPTRPALKPIASSARRWAPTNQSAVAPNTSRLSVKAISSDSIINTGAPFGLASVRSPQPQSVRRFQTSRFRSSNLKATQSKPTAVLTRRTMTTTAIKPEVNSGAQPTVAVWNQFLNSNQLNGSVKKTNVPNEPIPNKSFFSRRSGFSSRQKTPTAFVASRNAPITKFKVAGQAATVTQSTSLSKNMPSKSVDTVQSGPSSKQIIEQSNAVSLASGCRGNKLGKRFGPDMDIWCSANCKAGHCPQIYCICS
jgi:hypothetical protein